MAFVNTKCECGHQNAVGTVLCEACGKPQNEESGSDAVLEMRYDGVARKSQKANPSWIDRIWNFFSSVKIAIIIIIITLIGASLGTIYPQESNFISIDAATYYKQTYGTLGHIYYLLGLSHTYESWWFITLLVMIGASLVICSLDRVLPLYRALHKQKVRKHEQFITRQRVVYQGDIKEEPEAWLDKMSDALKKRGYRIVRDDGALLAEKNRFSRWGPYINHIGLIIFLLAVLARSIPGWHMEYYAGFPQGEPREIPNTPYYLQNDHFTVEYYSEDEMPEQFVKEGRVFAKLFETKATLFRCVDKCDDPVAEPVLEKVHQHDIRVNEPLEYDGISAYQFDFDLTPKLVAVKPELRNPATGEIYGQFELKVNRTEREYKVGPYTLELTSKFMDFGLNSKGEPTNLSQEPNAPAFIFLIKGPGLSDEGEPYLYFPLQKDKVRFQQDVINGKMAERFELRVPSMEDVTMSESTSYLTVRKDTAMPFIWVGAAISMIGLVMGFYWQHRRVWLRLDGQNLALGAHTNKNWFGLRNEVARALAAADVQVDSKMIDRGGNKA
ncbi:cytochrome c biogenesis protein ResB [Paenibacillus melissococcoides]|uniref:Cytochrome c biogenesis protein ResB n=1 Tax=Paenibacillus melissococcoides TaxID=2912268 RepID=A0ABN8U3H4_9BACL|nr:MULTISPECIES: cytochrome c biogenesis protein ResB [Paenibacillus]MEB9895572.1 cytochrome c biogenesis protein ResB [Bacillus cereus]CAH8245617.1 cytochrome c biogenesis protein ResB [Paenibacillus melissococcoides]CAH8711481.1 cytochrome c biogenesis protein ResB [Paenibacillus melissococcoides]CAH8712245.1 cytochrome c biogenesis protein ResB [Paenibacillus melissococcoides]GIO76953.1 cytochrome c biogenesis protein ResB [Paenibacillus dendritiformis]